MERDRRRTPCGARCAVRDRTRWRGVFLGGLDNFITADKEANRQMCGNGESCDNDATKRGQK